MQTNRIRVNLKSILSGAAAGMIVTVLLILILAFLLYTGKTDVNKLEPMMTVITVAAGAVCGIYTKKRGRGEGSINAIISGLAYSAAVYICACLFGSSSKEAGGYIPKETA